MKSFKEYCLLREMPYYEDQQGNFYDLEMELYKEDLPGFRNKILDLLKGKELTDKRGNSLILKTEEDLKNFLNWLHNDNQVLLFLKMRHKVDPVAFLDNIVNEL